MTLEQHVFLMKYFGECAENAGLCPVKDYGGHNYMWLKEYDRGHHAVKYNLAIFPYEKTLGSSDACKLHVDPILEMCIPLEWNELVPRKRGTIQRNRGYVLMRLQRDNDHLSEYNSWDCGTVAGSIPEPAVWSMEDGLSFPGWTAWMKDSYKSLLRQSIEHYTTLLRIAESGVIE